MLADNFLYMTNDKEIARNDIAKLAKIRFEFSFERLIIIKESNTWLFTSTAELTSKFGKLKGAMC